MFVCFWDVLVGALASPRCDGDEFVLYHKCEIRADEGGPEGEEVSYVSEARVGVAFEGAVATTAAAIRVVGVVGFGFDFGFSSSGNRDGRAWVQHRRGRGRCRE